MSLMASLSDRLRASDALRTAEAHTEQQLEQQVTKLQTEKEQLLDIQRVRQETSNLVIHDLRNPLAILSSSVSLLEMVLPDALVEKAVDTILKTAKTGKIGDGKIFLSRVEEAIRIRNEERGEKAL